MNKQFTTRGIVLTRTNVGEADRIITFLTPESGKVSALAKSVRKSTSKLAGGIELFSVSELTFVVGKSHVYTLISSRLVKHYGNIVKNLDRTNAGYDLIKILNKATEDHLEPEYFELLNTAFASLDNKNIYLDLIYIWFYAHLLKLAGHNPDLHIDASGNKLGANKKYDFDYNSMRFAESPEGGFSSNHVKFLRLVFGNNTPQTLQNVRGYESLSSSCLLLLNNLQSFR